MADRLIVIVGGAVVADAPPSRLGDRNRARARVSFRALPGVGVDEVPVPMEADGPAWTAEVADVTSTLHMLTTWAVDHHLELEDLTVTRTSLEDTYLELTR